MPKTYGQYRAQVDNIAGLNEKHRLDREIPKTGTRSGDSCTSTDTKRGDANPVRISCTGTAPASTSKLGQGGQGQARGGFTSSDQLQNIAASIYPDDKTSQPHGKESSLVS